MPCLWNHLSNELKNLSIFEGFVHGLYEALKKGVNEKSSFLKEILSHLQEFFTAFYDENGDYPRIISKSTIDLIRQQQINKKGFDASWFNLKECFKYPHLSFIYLDRLSELYFEKQIEGSLKHNELAIDLFIIVNMQIHNIKIENSNDILNSLLIKRRKILKKIYAPYQDAEC